MYESRFKISLKFVPRVLIDNISALGIMWTDGDEFTNAYMRHSATKSWTN